MRPAYEHTGALEAEELLIAGAGLPAQHRPQGRIKSRVLLQRQPHPAQVIAERAVLPRGLRRKPRQGQPTGSQGVQPPRTR